MRIFRGLSSWAILGILALIWGTSFILIKYGLKAFSPQQVAGLRIGIAAVAFAPVFWRRRKRVDWKKWPYLLVVGLCGSALPAFLFALAQTHINSTMAGILNSLTPIFTLVLGILFFRQSFEGKKTFGIVLGLLGALLLIVVGEQAGVRGNAWYGLLVVLATIGYATSGNTVGAYLNKMNVLTISAVSYGMVGIPMLIMLFSTDFLEVMRYREGAWASLGYVTILSLLSTFFASMLFFDLIQRTNAVFGSTIAYLIPLVALLWGIADGEVVGWWHLLGMGLILSGVYLARGRRKESEETLPTETSRST